MLKSKQEKPPISLNDCQILWEKNTILCQSFHSYGYFIVNQPHDISCSFSLLLKCKHIFTFIIHFTLVKRSRVSMKIIIIIIIAFILNPKATMRQMFACTANIETKSNWAKYHFWRCAICPSEIKYWIHISATITFQSYHAQHFMRRSTN